MRAHYVFDLGCSAFSMASNKLQLVQFQLGRQFQWEKLTSTLKLCGDVADGQTNQQVHYDD